MANSFTTVPNVLPGNVTIGGNLTVAGDVLRIGSVAPYHRIGKTSSTVGEQSFNYDFIGGAVDTANYAWRNRFSLGLPGEQMFRYNPAGQNHTEALLSTLLSDYTSHTNTGNTTENTIYSKTIRGNLLGSNGALRIIIGLTADVQGAVQSTIRVRLGGTSLCAWSPVTADNGLAVYLMGVLFNVNSLSSQKGIAWKVSTNGTFATTPGVGALNTANDQSLTITAQCGAATDQQTLLYCAVELVNTFGPVT